MEDSERNYYKSIIDRMKISNAKKQMEINYLKRHLLMMKEKIEKII